MKSRDFCFWLQGYFELNGLHGTKAISEQEAAVIRNHLALVFKHEIDPSIDGSAPPSKPHLDAIHHGPFPPQHPGGPVFRC